MAAWFGVAVGAVRSCEARSHDDRPSCSGHGGLKVRYDLAGIAAPWRLAVVALSVLGMFGGCSRAGRSALGEDSAQFEYHYKHEAYSAGLGLYALSVSEDIRKVRTGRSDLPLPEAFGFKGKTYVFALEHEAPRLRHTYDWYADALWLERLARGISVVWVERNRSCTPRAMAGHETALAFYLSGRFLRKYSAAELGLGSPGTAADRPGLGRVIRRVLGYRIEGANAAPVFVVALYDGTTRTFDPATGELLRKGRRFDAHREGEWARKAAAWAARQNAAHREGVRVWLVEILDASASEEGKETVISWDAAEDLLAGPSAVPGQENPTPLAHPPPAGRPAWRPPLRLTSSKPGWGQPQNGEVWAFLVTGGDGGTYQLEDAICLEARRRPGTGPAPDLPRAP